MKNFQYNILYKYLPDDVISIIVEYYKDLLRKDLNDIYNKYVVTYYIKPTWGYIASEIPDYYSILITRNSFTNSKVHTMRMLLCGTKSYLSRWYNTVYSYYKRGYDQFPIHSGHNQMNKVNNKIFSLMHFDKIDIVDECRQNNIRVSKKWSKQKLIQALLKV